MSEGCSVLDGKSSAKFVTFDTEGRACCRNATRCVWSFCHTKTAGAPTGGPYSEAPRSGGGSRISTLPSIGEVQTAQKRAVKTHWAKILRRARRPHPLLGTRPTVDAASSLQPNGNRL